MIDVGDMLITAKSEKFFILFFSVLCAVSLYKYTLNESNTFLIPGLHSYLTTGNIIVYVHIVLKTFHLEFITIDSAY